MYTAVPDTGQLIRDIQAFNGLSQFGAVQNVADVVLDAQLLRKEDIVRFKQLTAPKENQHLAPGDMCDIEHIAARDLLKAMQTGNADHMSSELTEIFLFAGDRHLNVLFGLADVEATYDVEHLVTHLRALEHREQAWQFGQKYEYLC